MNRTIRPRDLVAVLACAGALIAFPSGASAAAGGGGSDAKVCHSGVPAGGTNGQSCSPKTSGGKDAAEGVDIPKTIAEQVAKMAGQKVAGFIFAQVGFDDLVNGPQANFNAVKNQLGAISQQLTDVQTSVNQISAQLQVVALRQYTQPMDSAITRIDDVFRNKFVPAYAALTQYADQQRALPDGKTCDDVKACSDARGTYVRWRDNEFLPAMEKISSDNQEIHSRLIPDRTKGSAMIGFGQVLMSGPGTTGFLTSADSDRLRAFYGYYAEYEALATLMKAEAFAVKEQDLPASVFQAFLDEEVTKYQNAEKLPPAIPAGVVIALSAKPTEREKTLDQPMWMWNANLGVNTQWDPSTPATTAHTVPAALQGLNGTSAGLGFSDWRVPGKADWDRLFTGRATTFPGTARNPMTGTRFLETILPSTGGSALQILDAGFTSGNPNVWTSEPPATLQCVVPIDTPTGPVNHFAGYVPDYTHTAIPVAGGLAGYPSGFGLTTIPSLGSTLTAPQGLSNDAALQWCKDTAKARVTAGFATYSTAKGTRPAAQLIPTRSATSEYMPVAP